MEGTIKVDPQQLISTAEGLKSKANELQNLCETMATIASGLQSGWEGNAALAYINKVTTEKDDVADCVRKVNARATELQEMAQNYISADSKNESTASSLNVNVVEL